MPSSSCVLASRSDAAPDRAPLNFCNSAQATRSSISQHGQIGRSTFRAGLLVYAFVRSSMRVHKDNQMAQNCSTRCDENKSLTACSSCVQDASL